MITTIIIIGHLAAFAIGAITGAHWGFWFAMNELDKEMKKRH